MKLLNEKTPIEKYKIGSETIHVKREDLCTPDPGPTFSKVRGLLPRLLKLKEEGITTVGYTESSISMAGWGVAWVCSMIRMRCVIFDPQYIDSGKEHLNVLAYHRTKWKKLGATIVPIPAGMVKVNFNICSNTLKKEYQNSIMLPLGLPFWETIVKTSWIAEKVRDKKKYGSVILCVGSGTICAGVVKAFQGHAKVYGIMTRSGDKKRKRKAILKKAGIIESGFFGSQVDFDCKDPGWEYTERSGIDCPFPCHAYYDLKAWEYLIKNYKSMKNPILFWNIGS